VVADAGVPDRVSLFERALGVSKLSRAMGKRTMNTGIAQPYRLRSRRRMPRLLAGGDHTGVARLDLDDHPQLVEMTDEVADLGDLALVVDLCLTSESERHPLKLTRGHGLSSSAPLGAMAWLEERQGGGSLSVLLRSLGRGGLNEPLASAPFVLAEEHPAELDKRVGAYVVECPEDALAIFNRERHDLGFEREGRLEKRARRLVHEFDQLAHVLVGDPHTGDIHDAKSTPCMSVP
jgi:hypothetical protein